jgi:hypothetical protein
VKAIIVSGRYATRLVTYYVVPSRVACIVTRVWGGEGGGWVLTKNPKEITRPQTPLGAVIGHGIGGIVIPAKMAQLAKS